MNVRSPGTRRRMMIMGAGGRDFHDFNVVFRGDLAVEVVAITATQIPGIDDRIYPPSLAGPLYRPGSRSDRMATSKRSCGRRRR